VPTYSQKNKKYNTDETQTQRRKRQKKEEKEKHQTHKERSKSKIAQHLQPTGAKEESGKKTGTANGPKKKVELGTGKMRKGKGAISFKRVWNKQTI